MDYVGLCPRSVRCVYRLTNLTANLVIISEKRGLFIGMIVSNRKKWGKILSKRKKIGNFVANLQKITNTNKDIMSEIDKDLVFSEGVKAGKRIYYFDVKQSRNGDKYIAITESKKINEGTIDNPRFTFQKHKLFLYKEDYEKFVDALNRTLEVAKGNISPEEAAQAKADYMAEHVEEAVAEEPADDEQEEKAEKKSFLDKVKDIF